MLRVNQGKPRIALLPSSFWQSYLGVSSLENFDRKLIRDMIKVLEYGSEKYFDYNWAKGGSWTKVAESAMRHLVLGDGNDPETGLPDLAHFACNLMFLLDFTQTPTTGADDRFKLPERNMPEFVNYPSLDRVLLNFTNWMNGGDRNCLMDCLYFLNEAYSEATSEE